MVVTKKQNAANKRNAQKSTGPVTSIGKKRVSANAIQHGILSTNLILPGESEEDYQDLLDELIASWNPTISLERITLEKLAINLWRQRREIAAETAEISLQVQSESIAKMCTTYLGCESIPVMVRELEATDEQHSQWYEEMLIEYKYLAQNHKSDDVWPTMKEQAPTVYHFFQNIAETTKAKQEDFENYKFKQIGLSTEILESETNEIYFRRSRVLQVAELMRIKCQVLQGGVEQKYTRYQTMLDNEFNKLLNTLLNLIKMRPHFIDGDAVTIDQE